MSKGKMVLKTLDAMEERDVEVIELRTLDNAVDVIGTVGGDVLNYRVHFEDGEITCIGCK